MNSSNPETKSERVLVVGGSSGMGHALARSLLVDGAQVTIVGRSETTVLHGSLGERTPPGTVAVT
jgi:NAD(P)-dependent dehydrogenase (short-subunit alcohol dehydrogenase family)